MSIMSRTALRSAVLAAARRTIAGAMVLAGTSIIAGTLPAFAQTAQTADVDACLARPTVTCSVDLALSASAASHEDYERTRLALRASQRIADLGARKAYIDRMAARFFATGSDSEKYLASDRRALAIAAAMAAGDAATADRLLAEIQDNFQHWWTALGAAIDMLAGAGKPELAAALEASHRRAVTVNRSDALGRNLGSEIWSTQQPLALALVRCACGPDPLAMALALPKLSDRIGLAAILYARRHDLDGMTALLSREFGDLAKITDKTQRQWIGHAFGAMLNAATAQDVVAILKTSPGWLTADDFERPADFGMPGPGNIYGDALARAVQTGDRAAIAATLKLRPRGDTVWLAETAVDRLDATALDAIANTDDLLPKPERDHLQLLRINRMLASGDARKGADQFLKTATGRLWRKARLDAEDAAEIEAGLLAPLLARGAYDVAQDTVKKLRAADARSSLLDTIAAAKRDAGTRAAPADIRAKLAASWRSYQAASADPAAGRAFLFAVRDLIAAQPAGFPFE